MKPHSIKLTKKQFELMKEYWKLLKRREENYYNEVATLEKEMSEIVGIKNLVFFHCDGEVCGIGNHERTLGLIQREELEKK
jgi:hypothetical protein